MVYLDIRLPCTSGVTAAATCDVSDYFIKACIVCHVYTQLFVNSHR